MILENPFQPILKINPDEDRFLMYADEIVINPNVDYINASDEDILYVESYCQPFDTELHLLTLIEEALK